MDDITKREPIKITAEDINPRYNWGRHLPVLGAMGVDFEERVDYRRMHRYRLGRTQAMLEKSDLGALLLFDDNNVRYVTSTKIGEWARDKLSRWVLLPRGGDPILWDFGSAAVHHRLYSPWLKPENCKAGLVGLRGTVDPAFGLMKHHAEEIASILKSAGVGKMPVGVDIIEPPMMFELEKAGLKVKDGQQTMLEAREVKSADEIALLTFVGEQMGGIISKSLLAEANARLLEETQEMKRQLETRKLVERAKGILQQRYHLTEEEAYLRLRNESRRLRRPMKDLAEAIILAEDLSRKSENSEY